MKLRRILTALLVITTLFAGSFPVYADEPYTNTEYWEEYCDFSNGNATSQQCREYRYNKLKDSNARIQELEEATANISSNIDEALARARDFESQAAQFESEIATLAAQIGELTDRINELMEQIEANQALVSALNERVLTRMRNSQATMHFNPFLDLILGSKDLADLNRRSYGIQAIMAKDKEDRDELLDVIQKLEKDEQELDEKKTELDEKKIDLETQQAEYYELEKYYQAVAAEWEVQLEAAMNALEDEKRNYQSIAAEIDLSGIPSSEGFISPVIGSWISAGVWHYPSGGVHLGVDYAVGIGTNLYAPANGVIIVSSDGCGYGYLGNSCSGNGGGVAYGGNQVIMMVAAGGNIYGVSFFHMLAGTPRGTGTVTQGEYIGQVGSSGNSTGPHCHIELYYLGEGDIVDLQTDYLLRSYSSSFNCGWGSYALNRLCENGVGAPCRLNPAAYFGG